MVQRERVAVPAMLLRGRERLPLGERGVTIGRGGDCDLVLPSPDVSRRHARIATGGGGYEIEDLGSRNGTLVNGTPVPEGGRPLAGGDTIEIGGERLRFVVGEPTEAGLEPPPRRPRGPAVAWQGRPITIGRDPANDIALDDPNVSRFHAELVPGRDGRPRLRDLGSRNGSRVDGRAVRSADVPDGAEIGIGPFRLQLEDGSVVASDDRGALRLDARGVTVRVRGAEILSPTTLSVEPGQLVGVIGRSGCGKTTLVRALAGVAAPSDGAVTLNGEPVSARLTDIGYVPQDEIVHGLLTPREALRYAARLRLPRDTSPDEVEQAVERALAELDIGGVADRRVDTLSGGERKRVGVAVELLGRPGVLFLDEPTTGLDPGLERRMMELLRELADGSRAVIVVTHATRSLQLCDRLAVLGPGGHVHFHGPPDAALEHFGARDHDELYDLVDRAEPPRTEHPPGASRPEPPRRTETKPRPRTRGSLGVLVRRYIRLLLRDRRNVAILLAQAPLLGLAIGALFGGEPFERNRDGNPNDAAQILFLLVTTTIWLGSIAAAREVVKERTVVARERAIGVGLGSYLLSKMAVLFGLVVLQTALLAGTAAALQPLHAPAGAMAEALGILLVTGMAAIGMGLMVSALARSQDQATSFIPLALLPQLLFAGAIVPISKMGPAIEALSSLAFARWAFSGIGTSLDMNGRLADDAFDSQHSPYGRDFFVTSEWEALALLATFLAVFAAATALLLRRRA